MSFCASVLLSLLAFFVGALIGGAVVYAMPDDD